MSVMQKIIAILVIITTSILTGFGVYDYWNSRAKFMRETEASTHIVADRLAENLIHPLWNMDGRQVKRSMISEMAEKEIYAILVRESKGGKILYGMKKDDTTWEISENQEEVTGNVIVVARDITRDDQPLGSVEVYSTLKLMAADLREMVNRIVLRTLFMDVSVILVLYFFIRRFTVMPLNRIAEGLIRTAEDLSHTSSQVASASFQLSDGNSSQATSLQETSASLETLAPMIQQNAENAGQISRIISDKTSAEMEKANESVSKLIQFIQNISETSQETQKIIRTIDEIAFQTNLLALNAAVEAARAGEAGAGFAVVAEEVRNLAMRTAAAAKNTTAIIENTVSGIQNGSALVSTANDAFGQMRTGRHEITELLGKMAQSTDEQSQGMQQIRTAVNEVDRVVQQNAANAEELAATASQMDAQAENMDAFVKRLTDLIGRNGVSPGRKKRISQ